MKIILSGVTGFIGQELVRVLSSEGHELVILVRNPSKAPPSFASLHLEKWDGKSPGPWTRQMEDADAVINLAGEGIASRRWTRSRKRILRQSRVHPTRALVEATKAHPSKPRVFINASAIGYYGFVDEGDLTETSPKGEGFLAETCERWEEEALKAASPNTRLVILRIGVVLEKGGGALRRMIPPFRSFMGGPLGHGRQWFPWIHRKDIIGMIQYALRNDFVSGIANATAPEPVRMKELCRVLGQVLHRPSWAPVPGFVLKILLGELSDLLLKGQKVLPQRMTEWGYTFQYPSLKNALKDILD